MVKFWTGVPEVTGTDNETTQIEKSGVPIRRRKSKKTVDRECHPHERVQQIQEKPGQVEN